MPDWMFQIVGMGAGAVAVYVGIRSDLAALRVKADLAAESAKEAHERIDRILERD